MFSMFQSSKTKSIGVADSYLDEIKQIAAARGITISKGRDCDEDILPVLRLAGQEITVAANDVPELFKFWGGTDDGLTGPDARAAFYFAKDKKGKLLGFAFVRTLYVHDGGNDEPFFEWVVTDSSVSRQGIGTMLVAVAIAWAEKKFPGCTELPFQLPERNKEEYDRAASFHKRNGAKRKNEYGFSYKITDSLKKMLLTRIQPQKPSEPKHSIQDSLAKLSFLNYFGSVAPSEPQNNSSNVPSTI